VPRPAAKEPREAPPPPHEEEEVVEIDLEGEDLTGVMEAGDEEELVLEVEGEDEGPPAAPPSVEPQSVADALALVKQGAAGRAEEYLEERLGQNPGDLEAWSALVEARRNLGDRPGMRDALLRLAALHRKSARFDDAHAAYRAALDADPRSAAAARGLTELLLEEDAASAPPAAAKSEPQAPHAPPAAEDQPAAAAHHPPASVPAAAPPPSPAEPPAPVIEEATEEEEISFDLIEEAEEAPGGTVEPEAPQEQTPEWEPERAAAAPTEDGFAGTSTSAGEEVEPEPVGNPLIEPGTERGAEPEPESSFEDLLLEPEPEPEREPEPAPEPTAAAPTPPPEEPAAAAAAPAETTEGGAEQLWGFDDLLGTAAPEGPAATAAEPAAPPVFDPAVPPAPPPRPEPGPAPASGPEEFTLEGFGDDLPEFAAPAAAAPPAPVLPPPHPAPAVGQEFEEFLAEADFYFQQGLVDEAEFLYKKLLQLSPGHPEVARKLHKLEESRGPAPAAAGGLDTLDEQLDMAFGEEAAAAVDLPAFAAPERAPGGGAPPGEAASDFSDFLDGLRQELTSQEAPAPPPPLQGDEGLTEIFQEFQRSVKEQLGDEDFETHYNLGIAYKEMGLMDEAVAEFALAEKSPVRRLNAVSMIALCLREAGRFDEAALKLRTGISLATEGSEEQKGFLYDLAALHEQAGRAADAQDALQRLAAIDPGYRDVASRVGPPAAAPAAAAPPRKKPKVSYL
jgi:tetratricopeptide (TPR) repeat protein